MHFVAISLLLKKQQQKMEMAFLGDVLVDKRRILTII